ncbi:MAG: biosynthetic-type acetolactate synthase large subunit [Oscillospiraceae bacterium]|nr:biosynthetic-type acetolactate synthase large subunit [Oscillospiraceae bacterium]
MRVSGAEIIVECILEHGVDTVFGIPGGTVLPLIDALYASGDRITHILTAHEQAAAHAADGYARASCGPGVCVATGGPGATNLCTGITAAYMDSVPIVCITGNVHSTRIGTDCFQEVDILGMTIPVTKHNYQVKSVSMLLGTLREAFRLAVSGRPGPVLVDIAADVMRDTAEYSPPDEDLPLPSETPIRAGKLISRIERASAPLLLAGGGVIRAGAASRLTELAERLDIPVVTTLMGLGAIPSSHPLFIGMVGLHGRKEANLALTRADLLIAVGTRFSDRSLGDNSDLIGRLPLIHIDIDRAEMGKLFPPEHFLISDAKIALDALLRAEPQTHPKWREWLALGREEAAAVAPSYPEQLLTSLGRIAGPEALICTDVGQHQMWAAQQAGIERPGHFITSGGAGAMGFGLGAAIGAQSACPEKTVVLVTGDGSLQMSLGELSTVTRYALPITIAVINNHSLGMIRQLQTLFYGGRCFASSTEGAPDFVRLAASYGIDGGLAASVGEFEILFKEALESRRPALIDCRVPRDAVVRPMMNPGGRGNTSYILD